MQTCQYDLVNALPPLKPYINTCVVPACDGTPASLKETAQELADTFTIRCADEANGYAKTTRHMLSALPHERICVCGTYPIKAPL
jgi:hypothetical protein